MTATREEFIENVIASGLMSGDELSEFLQKLPADMPSDDPKSLATRLVRAGRLTKYQAAAVFQGKTKGLVFGEYRVLDRIGAGGMGVVLKAEHRRMKRIVAVKVLPMQAMRDEAAVRRFYKEVEAAARLMHTNIVTAHDAGEQDGIHYLVMEFVDGPDLATLLQKSGPLPVALAVDYVVQTARGLEYAHGQGVVHRDIKPSNLLLGKDGVIKILDMGLARIREDISPTDATAAPDRLTHSGQVMGTCDYMAPEQAEDTRRADERSDIYSLGCTLYRLLTGLPMYQADSAVKAIIAHREAAVPSLLAKRPDATPELEAAFHRMVAKRPADRQQSMTELIAQLAPLAGRDVSTSSRGSIHLESTVDLSSPAAEQTEAAAVAERVAVSTDERTLDVSREPLRDTKVQRDSPAPLQERRRPLWLAAATGTVLLILAALGIAAAVDPYLISAWRSEDRHRQFPHSPGGGTAPPTEQTPDGPLPDEGHGPRIETSDPPEGDSPPPEDVSVRDARNDPPMPPTPPDNESEASPTGVPVEDSADRDNRAALGWILRRGGNVDVRVDGQTKITLAAPAEAARLPSEGSIRVVAAALPLAGEISGDDLRTLGKLEHLHWLELAGSRLAADAVEALAHLRTLRHLGLRASGCSPQQIAVIREALPACHIEADDLSDVEHTAATAADEPWVTARTTHRLAGHRGAIRAVAFSPDAAQLATASFDHTIRLWNPKTGEQVMTLTGHRDRVLAVVYAPDGKSLVSSSTDRTIRIWDLDSGADRTIYMFRRGWALSLAYAPDGSTLATGDTENRVVLWDMPAGTARGAKSGHAESVYSLAFSPDSRWLASGSRDATLRVIDAQSGQLRHDLKRHKGNILSLAFSPDGKMLASGCDAPQLHLWDAESGEVRASLDGHASAVHGLAFSPDGKLLASACYDWAIRLWNAEDGEPQATLGGHSDGVMGIAFDPKQTEGHWMFASCSADQTARLWRVEQIRPQLAPAERWINALELASPSRDAVGGNWRKSGDGIEVARGQWTRLALPVAPRGSYQFNVQFTRTEGDDGVSLALPVAGRQLLCTLGGYRHLGYVSGLSQIDGKDAPFNEARKDKSKLVSGTLYDVTAEVDIDERRQDVTVLVAVNGKPLIQWQGALSRLPDRSWNSCDDLRKLGLAAEQSNVTFHHAHLKMTRGQAALLCPPPSDAGRRAAEKVLALGGKLMVGNEGELRRVAAPVDLPASEFLVLAVDAAGTRFSDDHAWILLAWPELVAADLSDTLISDAALARLAELPRLAVLDLSSDRLSESALEDLARCESLRQLTLRDTPIPSQAIEQWSGTLPNLRVLR